MNRPEHLFQYTTQIRLHHTDAAGRVYFNQVFTLAHECYEQFLDEVYPLDALLATGDVFLPIVHAEADYYQPLKVAQPIVITMNLDKLGHSSFHLRFEITSDQDTPAAIVKTSHVCVDRETQRPIPVPEALRQALL